VRDPARPAAAGAALAAPQLRLTVVDADRHAGMPARATLRRWIVAALREGAAARSQAPAATLSVAFVGAAAGRRLNHEFRGRDYATNVLTFAYEQDPEVLADIVLCVPVLRREAREQGKSLRRHLAHLVVHGVLHAIGYDHESERDAQRMQQLESRILAQLRYPDPCGQE
jgi:probable rRNA maturation factor